MRDWRNDSSTSVLIQLEFDPSVAPIGDFIGSRVEGTKFPETCGDKVARWDAFGNKEFYD